MTNGFYQKRNLSSPRHSYQIMRKFFKNLCIFLQEVVVAHGTKMSAGVLVVELSAAMEHFRQVVHAIDNFYFKT